MMYKPKCKDCIHVEVCNLKPIVDEELDILDKSGINLKHPFIQVELKCSKFLDKTPSTPSIRAIEDKKEIGF